MVDINLQLPRIGEEKRKKKIVNTAAKDSGLPYWDMIETYKILTGKCQPCVAP